MNEAIKSSMALMLAQQDPPAQTIVSRHDLVMGLMNVPVLDDNGNETGETFSLIDEKEARALMGLPDRAVDGQSENDIS